MKPKVAPRKRLAGTVREAQYYWKCKDGRRLNVRSMEIEHIRHCLKLIDDFKGRWRAKFKPILKAELQRRREELESYVQGDIEKLRSLIPRTKGFTFAAHAAKDDS